MSVRLRRNPHRCEEYAELAKKIVTSSPSISGAKKSNEHGFRGLAVAAKVDKAAIRGPPEISWRSIAVRPTRALSTERLAEGEVRYGPRAEHCWNGDPAKPNWYSRLHYNQMYVPQIMERILKTAPAGADLTSWRY